MPERIEDGIIIGVSIDDKRAIEQLTRLQGQAGRVAAQGVQLQIPGLEGAQSRVRQQTEGIAQAQQAVAKNTGQANEALRSQLGQFTRGVRIGGSFTRSVQALGLAELPLGRLAGRLAGLGIVGLEIQPAFEGLAEIFPRLAGSLVSVASKLPLVVAGLGAVIVVGSALTAVLRRGIPLAIATEDVYAQIAARLRATGAVAGVTAAHIDGLAASMSSMTRFGRLATQQAAALLLTFDAVRNTFGAPIFDRALSTAADLATVLGVSLEEAIRKLGPALQDPITGFERLAEAGIRFTEAEKEQIRAATEVGDAVGAQLLILQRLTDTIGGVASETGETGDVLADFRKLIDDISRSIATQLLPPMRTIVGAAKDFAEGIDGILAPLGGFGAIIEGIAAEIKDVAEFFNAVGVAVQFLTDTLEGNPTTVSDWIQRNIIDPIPPLREFDRILKENQRTLEDIADPKAQERRESEAAAEAARKEATERRKAAEAQEEMARGIERVTEARRDLTSATIDQDKAELDLQESQLDNTRVLEDLADAEEHHRNILKGFPKDADEAIEAQADYDEALLGNREAILGISEAEVRRSKALLDLEKAQREYNGIINGYSRESKEAAEALEELDDAVREVTRSQLVLEQTTARLRSQQIEFAKQQRLIGFVVKAYGEDSLAAQGALAEFAETELDVRDAQLDIADAQDRVGDAQTDLTEAQQNANNVINGYAANTREAREATADLQRAQLDAAQSALGIERAHLRAATQARGLSEAEKDLRTTLRGYPADSDEAREAVRRLEDAQFVAKRQVVGYKDAVLGLARAQKEYNDQLKETNRLNEAFLEKLVRPVLNFPGSPLFGAFSGTRQFGGPVLPRRSYVVGESGPELFTPGSAGRVDPIRGTPSIKLTVGSTPVYVMLDGRVIARAIAGHQRTIVRERG